MTMRIGINGYGRMGRLFLRAAWGRSGLDVVHVNEIKGGAECAAHLTEFDSLHGRWAHECRGDGDAIFIDGWRIGFSEHGDPASIPWNDLGVDLVVESSGRFRTPEALQPHLDNGAAKVMVAAPVKQGALNIVYGINHHLYEPGKHHLVTAASCTTNCLAPVVKVMLENFGIERGVITTIHDVTNTQVVVDAPHKDLRRARSALTSLIPTTTGAATAITVIYPELEGKLNGHAIRVPLLNASITDCVFEVGREVTANEVNAALKKAAEGPLVGILGFEERPLVSSDFLNDPRSSIVDGPSTMVVDGRMVKIYAWYDNEWGYAMRMADIAAMIAAG